MTERECFEHGPDVIVQTLVEDCPLCDAERVIKKLATQITEAIAESCYALKEKRQIEIKKALNSRLAYRKKWKVKDE